MDIFFTFFRIGLLTFGGGYTVLPLLQQEVAVRKQWVSQEEIIDYYAVGQCLPGMMGVNTVILIGHKLKGKAGSASAALGFAAPSLAIILVIASLIQNFSELAIVQSAFAGIRAAVCALVVNAIYTMAKRGIVDPLTAIISATTCIAVILTRVSPVPLMILAAAAGLIISSLRGKLATETKTKAAGANKAGEDE